MKKTEKISQSLKIIHLTVEKIRNKNAFKNSMHLELKMKKDMQLKLLNLFNSTTHLIIVIFLQIHNILKYLLFKIKKTIQRLYSHLSDKGSVLSQIDQIAIKEKLMFKKCLMNKQIEYLQQTKNLLNHQIKSLLMRMLHFTNSIIQLRPHIL